MQYLRFLRNFFVAALCFTKHAIDCKICSCRFCDTWGVLNIADAVNKIGLAVIAVSAACLVARDREIKDAMAVYKANFVMGVLV